MERSIIPNHDNATPKSTIHVPPPHSISKLPPVSPGIRSLAMIMMARSAARTIELRKVLMVVTTNEMMSIAWEWRNRDVDAPINESAATMG